MNTLVVVHWQSSIDDKAVCVVFWVHIEIGSSQSTSQISTRHTWSVLVYSVVFPVVRIGSNALREGVSWIPVGGESSAAVEYELRAV